MLRAIHLWIHLSFRINVLLPISAGGQNKTEGSGEIQYILIGLVQATAHHSSDVQEYPVPDLVVSLAQFDKAAMLDHAQNRWPCRRNRCRTFASFAEQRHFPKGELTELGVRV